MVGQVQEVIKAYPEFLLPVTKAIKANLECLVTEMG